MVQQLNRVRALEERVRAGGGDARIRKQHAAGKLTARERIELLLDSAARLFEIGLLVAWDEYDGQAPAAGVVTGLGKIEGRVAVVVANDATVKAGAWWPETIAKILRAQEIAIRNRIPIVYLVDSAGVNLPLQDGIFPGQYGAGRIFYYNSLMRRKFRIPQIAAVMGPCIAGGAYLPALSDVMVMVEGTSFMGLGGPSLVKGATGAAVDAESLGGAGLHNRISGVAHYRAADDAEAIGLIRGQFRAFPAPAAAPAPGSPARSPSTLCDILPEDHRMSYDAGAIAAGIFDQADFVEFQPEYAPELLCAQAKLAGRPVAFIANRRGFVKTARGPRIGGVIYTESARKAGYFVEFADRRGVPLLYLQDTSGFMIGKEAESEGIIRAGAEMVESMACASVPKIVLTINHASGAGYYAMAGQGFDPHFTLGWPSARIGVMEGETAVQAIHGPEIAQRLAAGETLPEELESAIRQTKANYEHWLDATYAAARGHIDAIVDPAETRDVLAFLLEVVSSNPRGSHLPVDLLS